MNDGVLSGAYNKDYYALPWTRFPAYYTGVCCAIAWFEKEVRGRGINTKHISQHTAATTR
jgi:hypothetical protein